MGEIYYLFIDKEFCIQNVFENLQLAILEPGIKYSEIKSNDVLPPYIILTTIYKDQYLLKLIKNELIDMGYDKNFELLKPLSLT
jgi:hypothetical protein